MAYTKTTWAAGDTVTSQKLNKIENQLETLSNGGSAGCFVVNITEDISSNPPKSTDTKGGTTSGAVYVTDKTYNEIVIAFQNGSLPIGVMHEEEIGSGSIDRGASTGTSESWAHAIFLSAAFNATNLEYIISFMLPTSNGPLTFYATDPDNTLTTEEPDSGGAIV